MTVISSTRPGSRFLGAPVWAVKLGVVVVALVAAAFSVTVVPAGQAAKDDSTDSFSATAYATKRFPPLAKAITADAVPLPSLLSELKSDPTGTAEKYGHSSGANNPASYPVMATGTAGTAANGLLAVDVKGVPKPYTVYVQVGGDITSTAIRDVTGTVRFGQFVNQIDYQNAANALNAQVKKQVLAKVDAASLKGETVTVTGAFTTGVNPSFVDIIPVSIEAGS